MRTNADTPEDAQKAREFGAEGIGLCRTEHMFMAEDRLPHVRDMIMAESREERQKHLAKLLPFQREDFEGIFRAMVGLPVTIRLLDPPLHEFLPDYTSLMVRARAHEADRRERGAIAAQETLTHKVKVLHEMNPMLGTRGCRLGIQWPEIYEMQVQAIMEAALPRPRGADRAPAGRDHDPLGRLRQGTRDPAQADPGDGREDVWRSGPPHRLTRWGR